MSNNVNENNFKYHAPTPEKVRRHENVRNACQGLANVIASNCPQSHELSLAMTKIEEAMMWANAAIARTTEAVSDVPIWSDYTATRQTNVPTSAPQ